MELAAHRPVLHLKGFSMIDRRPNRELVQRFCVFDAEGRQEAIVLRALAIRLDRTADFRSLLVPIEVSARIQQKRRNGVVSQEPCSTAVETEFPDARCFDAPLPFAGFLPP